MAVQTTRAVADRASLGIALMLLAFFCFTGIDSSARWLSREAGLPPMQIVFVRYLGHLIIVSALFLPAYGADLWRTRNLPWELLRGLVLLGSTICNFTAVKYLPLSLTASIGFTAPLLVCALSAPLLGEKVGVRRWAAILVGLVGVLLVTRPWSVELHWAILIALCTAVCAALYGIATRKLAGVDTTHTQQFIAAVIATAGVAPFALSIWEWPSRAVDWLPFLCIGFFGWLGHQFLTIAHRYAPASTLAPFVYAQLLFLTTADFLIFSVAPDPWIFPGAAVVVGSGLYIWLREMKLSRPPSGRATPMR